MTRVDPFTGAVCRQPGADPRTWDDDADPAAQLTAAAACISCPAIVACNTARLELGVYASGTWAGQFHEWTEPESGADETVAAFTMVFGTSFDTAADRQRSSGQLELEVF